MAKSLKLFPYSVAHAREGGTFIPGACLTESDWLLLGKANLRDFGGLLMAARGISRVVSAWRGTRMASVRRASECDLKSKLEGRTA